MRRDYAHLKSTDVYRHVSWLSSMHAKAKLEDGIWEDRRVTKNFSKSNANFSLKKKTTVSVSVEQRTKTCSVFLGLKNELKDKRLS